MNTDLLLLFRIFLFSPLVFLPSSASSCFHLIFATQILVDYETKRPQYLV